MASGSDIQKAARLILDGELVAMPTETVYGLAADATNDRAVAKIFAAKNRPRFNPLIVHVASARAAREHVDWSEHAEKLAAEFWPGPLTLVLNRKPATPLSLLVSAGLDSVAIRVPDHDIAQALLVESARSLAAPSANRSGKISPTTADHVRSELADKVAAIIDGGRCRVGIESTVVDLSGDAPALLRPGGVAAEEIEACIGVLSPPAESGAPKSPGMLQKHYAPDARLRLNAAAPEDGESFLGFGGEAPDGWPNLSPEGDLIEAAANLFAMVRALDESGAGAIAVAPIPDIGVGRAINDRLRRAAHRDQEGE